MLGIGGKGNLRVGEKWGVRWRKEPLPGMAVGEGVGRGFPGSLLASGI